jgi:short-subunit dehydrogenase
MNAKLKKLFQQKVDGKTIIVTGASSGIGLTVSKYLAQAGAHVLLLARTKKLWMKSKQRLKQTVEKHLFFHVI